MLAVVSTLIAVNVLRVSSSQRDTATESVDICSVIDNSFADNVSGAYQKIKSSVIRRRIHHLDKFMTSPVIRDWSKFGIWKHQQKNLYLWAFSRDTQPDRVRWIVTLIVLNEHEIIFDSAPLVANVSRPFRPTKRSLTVQWNFGNSITSPTIVQLQERGIRSRISYEHAEERLPLIQTFQDSLARTEGTVDEFNQKYEEISRLESQLAAQMGIIRSLQNDVNQSNAEINRLESLHRDIQPLRGMASKCNEEEHRISQVIWCCIGVVIGGLIMLFVSCLYHRHRVHKHQWEMIRLRHILNNEKLNSHRSSLDISEEVRSPKSKSKDSGNVMFGESFTDLMQDIARVKAITMDELVEDIIVKGQERDAL